MSSRVNNAGIIIAVGVILFVLFVIFRIGNNVSKHETYKDDFNEKCIKAGGVTYTPKGTNGLQKSICFKKEALIQIGK